MKSSERQDSPHNYYLANIGKSEGSSSDIDEIPEEMIGEFGDRGVLDRPIKKANDLLFLLVGIVLALLVIVSMVNRPSTVSQFPAVVLDRTRIASIIEPRNLLFLGPLLLHFLAVLPPQWPMIAWVSKDNYDTLMSQPALVKQIELGRLNVTILPDEVDVHSGEYLSRFLSKPWFWEQHEAEWMLFFQSDSIICSKSEQSVEDWVGYDWVGAPWDDNPETTGGNGGFCMRKVGSMLRITRENIREDNGLPEDVWFVEHLRHSEGTVWAKNPARFSVENHHGSLLEWAYKPLGMHSGGISPWTWHDQRIMDKLIEWCPEVKLFYDPLTNLPCIPR